MSGCPSVRGIEEIKLLKCVLLSLPCCVYRHNIECCSHLRKC